MKQFVDEKKLKKISKLAKLEIKENEVEKYLTMINSSLAELEKIENFNTDNIEPLTNPYNIELRTYQDIPNDGNIVDNLMKNAPKELYNYFVVPKVIGGE